MICHVPRRETEHQAEVDKLKKEIDNEQLQGAELNKEVNYCMRLLINTFADENCCLVLFAVNQFYDI